MSDKIELPILFPFENYWWFYLIFFSLIAALLALDLGIFHKKARTINFKEATGWTFFWIGFALFFNFLFYQYALWALPQDSSLKSIPGIDTSALAYQLTIEFLTGFVVEKTLAIDNIFIFILVFSYFEIPTKFQHRILFFGVAGAVALRAFFIAFGSYLLKYKAVVLLSGAFLMLTGIKMLFTKQKKNNDISKNFLLRTIKKFIPISTQLPQDPKFFIIENGKLVATPLFVALLFLEFSDIAFAIDSVPAIFALTKEPLIVFTSNVFAILGLRSMYFMLAGLIDHFRYLKLGLGCVLIFIGLKMTYLNSAFGGKFPISLSLGIICSIILISVFVSLLTKKKQR